jgi:hypothetical protein
MVDNQMQEHLIKILNKFYMRTDLINCLFINEDNYIFKEDIPNEKKWNYYLWVCNELKINDKLVRTHGMKSELASLKKKGGHDEEFFFEKFGYEVKKGTHKTDLLKNNKSFASLKGGEKIQWGMHVINQLPDRFINLFQDWLSTFEENFVNIEKRKEYAEQIIKKLKNKELLKDLLNYYFRKNENVPFLIVKDFENSIYYRIDYLKFINILIDNVEFYKTNNKVKINARMNIDNGNKKVIFEIEPRSDKGNAILIHGLSKRVINIIKHYNLNVEEEYK